MSFDFLILKWYEYLIILGAIAAIIQVISYLHNLKHNKPHIFYHGKHIGYITCEIQTNLIPIVILDKVCIRKKLIPRQRFFGDIRPNNEAHANNLAGRNDQVPITIRESKLIYIYLKTGESEKNYKLIFHTDIGKIKLQY